jgi:hypothetical protein
MWLYLVALWCVHVWLMSELQSWMFWCVFVCLYHVSPFSTSMVFPDFRNVREGAQRAWHRHVLPWLVFSMLSFT